MLTNFSAASEGITSDKVIEKLIKKRLVAKASSPRDPRFKKIFAA